ncbi:hypothetical protein F5Y14DRAFT_448431 [Nemania sp. NC0429]|nr:hypothetical protein F5Y14DRAFT_448431 [Nemania sp. NC0429]
MDKETPSWLQAYQQPFVRRQNVMCESRHLHQQNMPAAGFVFVRLNAFMGLDVLLDLRSNFVADGGTWGFIGGYANDVEEDDLSVAYREAQEEYGITRDEIKLLGLSYKRDHGGVKYLTYTYIFAEYNPPDGQAPAPLTHESERSQWFNLQGGAPDNLNKYINEDRSMLDHILREGVWPILAQARDLDDPNALPQQAQTLQQTVLNTPRQVQYPNLPILEGLANNGMAVTSSQQAQQAQTLQQSVFTTPRQVQYPSLPFLKGLANNGIAVVDNAIQQEQAQQTQPLQQSVLNTPRQDQHPSLPILEGLANNGFAVASPRPTETLQQSILNTPRQVQYPNLPILEGQTNNGFAVADNEIQQQAFSPRKVEELMTQLKVPMTSPRVISRRNSAQGTAKKSVLPDRFLLGKNKDVNFVGGKLQLGGVGEDDTRPAETEVNAETATAGPNDEPPSFLSTWRKFFGLTTQEEPAATKSPLVSLFSGESNPGPSPFNPPVPMTPVTRTIPALPALFLNSNPLPSSNPTVPTTPATRTTPALPAPFSSEYNSSPGSSNPTAPNTPLFRTIPVQPALVSSEPNEDPPPYSPTTPNQPPVSRAITGSMPGAATPRSDWSANASPV